VLLAQAGICLNLLVSVGSRPLAMTISLMLFSGALLALAGMWITLQFRFIQMQYPAVVLAFERQVLTASLPVAAVMQVRAPAHDGTRRSRRSRWQLVMPHACSVLLTPATPAAPAPGDRHRCRV
jgi:hypothetical protein